MKRIAFAVALLLIVAGALRAVENASWSTVKAQEPAAKLVMSATKAGSGADYYVSGTGQSDPVDFFHLIFNWFKDMGITPYDDQYKDSRWVFISPFQAVGNDCQTQSYAPDATSVSIDMVVCDPAAGAEVRGYFHLERRLENEKPYAFDPAAVFDYPVIAEKPYNSWVGGSDARIVKFVLKDNRAALVAEDAETGSQIMWLVEDNGVQPITKIMGNVDNMLAWQGDRRTYIDAQEVWNAEEGIGSPEHLLYAAVRGDLESWPGNNKHLKAWPMGNIKVKSY